MKLIEVLNKIANGEEVPKHIMVIFEDETDVPEYEWNEKEKMYKIMEGNFGWDENLHIYPNMLNYTVIPINKKMSNKYKQELINKSYYDEIEIIEEDKPIEKITIDLNYANHYSKANVKANAKYLAEKINEIIDRITKLEKEGNK